MARSEIPKRPPRKNEMTNDNDIEKTEQEEELEAREAGVLGSRRD